MREHSLDSLARRLHVELYIRWMQAILRFKSSTGSRRFPVTADFYRTCVVDGLMEHSPENVLRGSLTVVICSAQAQLLTHAFKERHPGAQT